MVVLALTLASIGGCQPVWPTITTSSSGTVLLYHPLLGRGGGEVTHPVSSVVAVEEALPYQVPVASRGGIRISRSRGGLEKGLRYPIIYSRLEEGIPQLTKLYQ